MLDVEWRPNPSKGRSFGNPQAPPRNHHDKGKLLLKDLQEWWRKEGDRVGGRRGGAVGLERVGTVRKVRGEKVTTPIYT
jgi:hypothetical protein